MAHSAICASCMQMTSVFLHAFPPLVAWAQRWHPPDAAHWKGDTAGAAACAARTASVRELILIPWLPYALWAVGYYLKIFVISSRKIQDKGYHTLFRYMTRKPQTFFGRLARALPRWASPLIFMAWHVLFCAVTFVLTWTMWQSYAANTAFLVTMMFMSAWNGGNYYFEVFAKKYVDEMLPPAAAGHASAPRRSASAGLAADGESSDDEHLPRVVRASSDGALAGVGGGFAWPDSASPCAKGHALMHPVLRSRAQQHPAADSVVAASALDEEADFSTGLVHAQDAAHRRRSNGLSHHKGGSVQVDDAQDGNQDAHSKQN